MEKSRSTPSMETGVFTKRKVGFWMDNAYFVIRKVAKEGAAFSISMLENPAFRTVSKYQVKGYGTSTPRIDSSFLRIWSSFNQDFLLKS